MSRLTILLLSCCAGCFHSEGLAEELPFAETSPHDSAVAASDSIFQVDDASDDTATPTDTFVPGPDTAVVDTYMPPTCTDTGGVLWGGHCYFPLPTARPFDGQRDTCISRGAHLASVTSVEEEGVVNGIGTGDRWIGLVKEAASPSEKASFHWITGESAAGYDNWAMGDPNGGHNCARMMANGTWGDQACTTAFAAVCERD